VRSYNKQQQADFVTVSPFVHKPAQKSPLLLRGCAERYESQKMESLS
jgi:hypothetical protein